MQFVISKRGNIVGTTHIEILTCSFFSSPCFLTIEMYKWYWSQLKRKNSPHTSVYSLTLSSCGHSLQHFFYSRESCLCTSYTHMSICNTFLILIYPYTKVPLFLYTVLNSPHHRHRHCHHCRHHPCSPCHRRHPCRLRRHPRCRHHHVPRCGCRLIFLLLCLSPFGVIIAAVAAVVDAVVVIAVITVVAVIAVVLVAPATIAALSAFVITLAVI